ncbi:MAG: 4-hydroxyphenylpyruvate dioxygenase [Vampirovibrionales bacterium]|nr:4-hydroxyphenylpyruvate dioxygenase [Vampirovibrionales bacterium]
MTITTLEAPAPMTNVASTSELNPCGIQGIAFIEFAGPNPEAFNDVFTRLGLSKVRQSFDGTVFNYRLNNVHFLLNTRQGGFASQFASLHGQSACAMAFEVENPEAAFETAVARGATPKSSVDHDYLAVEGVGGSAIYFVNGFYTQADGASHGLEPIANPTLVPSTGFECIDHLTNNVEQGKKEVWSDFYKNIFGFTDLQFFDIRGEKTGLLSYALQSPCKTFSLPINEATEEKSQIAEYIREYHGEGIQHIALHTSSLLDTLDAMKTSHIATLDIDNDYYDTIFDRVQGVTEDKARIKAHQVLVDGDDEGYLLQIFTQNQFGPIFFEFIQRKQHEGFGHGNFGALFKSIERDQERRGVL